MSGKGDVGLQKSLFGVVALPVADCLSVGLDTNQSIITPPTLSSTWKIKKNI